VWKKIALFFGYILFLCIVIFSLLAPYLVYLGHPFAAAVVYSGMRAFCHQMPERSLFIWGYKMGLCSRCFAIFLSFFISGVIFFVLRKYLKKYYWKGGVILCIPLILDGTTQFFALRESTHFFRILTGSLFGLGFALIIFPLAFEMCLEDYEIELPARRKIK